ncbi:MAG: CBS domain-containing protein [Afipia sp.]|jgi:CBS domain-containing protein|nr:CBS domain-containing protein [Afipia sp.]WIG51430.1 MAG: hypothetical protein OJF48_002347 [Afipia sp.]
MRVTDIMRESFATVKPGTSLIEVARLLMQTNQRGLPVLDEKGELVGIVSEGNLLHRNELGVIPLAGNWLGRFLGREENDSARRQMRGLLVEEIMTPAPVCVEEDATVDDVVTVMDASKVGQVPVVAAGQVIGIVSRFELIAALERCLRRTEEEVSSAPTL